MYMIEYVFVQKIQRVTEIVISGMFNVPPWIGDFDSMHVHK